MLAVAVRASNLLAQVDYTPDAKSGNAVPGYNQLQDIVNNIAAWGLLLAGAAVVISAVIWAFGTHSQNSQQASAGKKGVIISIAAAIAIGAGPVFINWAFNLGKSAA
jgi:hypothetical protein